ncbi:phage major capsid protein [Paenibacillus sp.]|uniref:phage major capsid protein n=1 Tax=Paenibacillus sp. TaxID=58172 RepID=UPI002D41E91B|nr:phage major capsid protein [Paenibacillus sp.]HZG83838.1 phage major capsid protein [Paenibacillus sp.]
MPNITELQQERAQIWEQAKALNDRVNAEKRSFTAEEQQQWDKMNADMDRLGAQIDREKRMAETAAELEQRDGSPAVRQGGEERREEEKPALEREEYRAAYTSFLKYGYSGLTSEERSIIDAGKVQLSGQEARAMSSVTGTAGGYTVPVGFYNQLIQAMKAFGGMRQSRARVLRTSSGNDLPIPTTNDTSRKARIVGQNTAAGNATDPVFGQKTLKAYKYTSDTFLVPIELIQDSAFDVEQLIREFIASSFGRGTNEHFTVGTGTNEPQGVVTGAAQGKVGSTGQSTSVTFDDLFDLQHSVDVVYRAMAEWMFNDNTLKAIRKLKDGDGRPLWQPSLTASEPDLILGKPYVINTDMADMAANAKPILFGDFSNYFIRDVMDLTIFRLGEKYIESGQIGFIAYARHDGLMVDAGTGPIKYYQNSAS